jgi:hypothetical protein
MLVLLYFNSLIITGIKLAFCIRKQKKKKGKQVVGLERGSLSLVSTTEELLDRKVAVPV